MSEANTPEHIRALMEVGVETKQKIDDNLDIIRVTTEALEVIGELSGGTNLDFPDLREQNENNLEDEYYETDPV